MTTEPKIVLWWVLFGGTHMVGSSLRVRNAVIDAIGLRGFKTLYSLVAFATFVPLCYVYFADRHAGGMLFTPGAIQRSAAQALMLLALFVLFQGLVTLSPLTTHAEMTRKYPEQPRGILRLTRHPQNLAFALFGIAHCLALPFAGDWLFFGGFVVYAVASAIHQDRRTHAAGPEAARRFQQQTSLVPFAAILGGRQRLAPGEYRLGAALVAVAAFLALRYFHGSLFGGFGR